MKNTLIILLLVFSHGCATSIVQYSDATPVTSEDLGDAFEKYSKQSETTGTVIVVRDTGFLGAAGEADFFVNGELIAEVGVKESVKIYLEPQEYLVGIGPGASVSLAETKKYMEEQAVLIESGKTYYYRISVIPSKGLVLQRTSLIH